MHALAAGASACLTVTIVDGLVLARSAFEHSTNYDSVMVFGRFSRGHRCERAPRGARAFTEKLIPGRWSEVRGPSPKELKATRDPRHADCGGVGETAFRPAQTTTTVPTPRSTPGRARSHRQLVRHAHPVTGIATGIPLSESLRRLS
jgi:hypothetical protein